MRESALAGARVATVRDALAAAAASLAAAGCETPRLDAELLLAAACGVDRARLVLDSRRALDADPQTRFEELVARRAAREPVAYILGRKPFRRITLGVTPDVLIPRPETELLVEVGVTLPAGARVIDVGTGSGAVALALKDERPDLDVLATDVSDAALAVARSNAVRLGLDVGFVRADLTGGIAVDAVLANLPYVADDSQLAPEITCYEPAGAVFAGPDGLDVIRRLVDSVASDGGVGLVGLEVGFDQADAVAGLLRDAGGFGTVERRRDLAGHERVVVGRR